MIPIEDIDYVALRGVEWMRMPDKYPHISMSSDFRPFSEIFAQVENITNSILYETD